MLTIMLQKDLGWSRHLECSTRRHGASDLSEEFQVKAVSVAWHDRSCCLLRRNTRIGRLLKRADHSRYRLKRHNKLFVCRSFSADESYLERRIHIGKSKIINDQRQDLEYGDACEERKKEVWRKKKKKKRKKKIIQVRSLGEQG